MPPPPSDPRPDAQIRVAVEMDGYPEDHPLHEALVVGKKVERCQAARGVDSCGRCSHYELCGLIKTHLINLKHGPLKAYTDRFDSERGLIQ